MSYNGHCLILHCQVAVSKTWAMIQAYHTGAYFEPKHETPRTAEKEGESHGDSLGCSVASQVKSGNSSLNKSLSRHRGQRSE